MENLKWADVKAKFSPQINQEKEAYLVDQRNLWEKLREDDLARSAQEKKNIQAEGEKLQAEQTNLKKKEDEVNGLLDHVNGLHAAINKKESDLDASRQELVAEKEAFQKERDSWEASRADSEATIKDEKQKLADSKAQLDEIQKNIDNEKAKLEKERDDLDGLVSAKVAEKMQELEKELNKKKAAVEEELLQAQTTVQKTRSEADEIAKDMKDKLALERLSWEKSKKSEWDNLEKEKRDRKRDLEEQLQSIKDQILTAQKRLDGLEHEASVKEAEQVEELRSRMAIEEQRLAQEARAQANAVKSEVLNEISALKASKVDLKASVEAMEHRIQELQATEARWKASLVRKKASSDMHEPSGDALVRLNVGGRAFTTTEQTLTHKSSMFQALLSSPELRQQSTDVDGALFINRCGDAFAAILHWMRTGALFVPSPLPPALLAAEADYYLLESFPIKAPPCGDKTAVVPAPKRTPASTDNGSLAAQFPGLVQRQAVFDHLADLSVLFPNDAVICNRLFWRIGESARVLLTLIADEFASCLETNKEHVSTPVIARDMVSFVALVTKFVKTKTHPSLVHKTSEYVRNAVSSIEDAYRSETHVQDADLFGLLSAKQNRVVIHQFMSTVLGCHVTIQEVTVQVRFVEYHRRVDTVEFPMGFILTHALPKKT